LDKGVEFVQPWIDDSCNCFFLSCGHHNLLGFGQIKQSRCCRHRHPPVVHGLHQIRRSLIAHTLGLLIGLAVAEPGGFGGYVAGCTFRRFDQRGKFSILI
jgi:hypothetical protein